MGNTILGDSWANGIFQHVYPGATVLGKPLARSGDVQYQIKGGDRYIIHVGMNDFLFDFADNIINHYTDCLSILWRITPLYNRKKAEFIAKRIFKIVQPNSIVCIPPLTIQVPFIRGMMMMMCPIVYKKVTVALTSHIKSVFVKELYGVYGVDMGTLVEMHTPEFEIDGLQLSKLGSKTIANNWKVERIDYKLKVLPKFKPFEVYYGTFLIFWSGIFVIPIVYIMNFIYKRTKKEYQPGF